MTQTAPGTPASLPSVSVVIPTYRRRDGLSTILTPLLEDAAATEVIVVDDGSGDGTYEWLLKQARDHPRLRPLRIDNRGESGARLAGVQTATGEVVLLLDDDVEAEPGLVGAHARRHAEAADPDLLIAGYMPVADPDRAATRLYAESYEAHVGRWREGQSVIATIWAGNLSMRRAAYLRVNARPAPARYDFHADRVFGFACAEAGLHGVYAPECRARHHYRRDLTGLARDARRQGDALVRMAREFPDAAAPLRRDAFTRYLPASQRRLVEFARRPRADALIRAAVRLGTGVIDAGGHPLATRGADLLATLERQRGAIDASRTGLGV